MEFSTVPLIIFFLPWKENKSFDEVLLNAKKLGYAESNPSSDLNGMMLLLN